MNYYLDINRKRLSLLGVALVGLSPFAQAFDTFAFQGLYAGNGGAFTSISGNGSANNASNPFTANASFTGLDRAGNVQTMLVNGSAWSYADFGKIHIHGEGTVTNSYYNEANPAYFDGTLNTSGSPDLLAMNGNAGWTDTFTFTGLSGVGYKVNYYFRLTGSVSGDTEAGLNFSTSAPGSLSYNPRTSQGNELWITPFYEIGWGTPTTVTADFYAGMNTRVSERPDGSTYSSSASYGNTLTLEGMKVFDSNNNEVTGWRLSAASGTNYPVPEPASMIALTIGLVGIAKRKKK